MLPNVVNNDDFELARSAKRELMPLAISRHNAHS